MDISGGRWRFQEVDGDLSNCQKISVGFYNLHLYKR